MSRALLMRWLCLAVLFVSGAVLAWIAHAWERGMTATAVSFLCFVAAIVAVLGLLAANAARREEHAELARIATRALAEKAELDRRARALGSEDRAARDRELAAIEHERRQGVATVREAWASTLARNRKSDATKEILAEGEAMEVDDPIAAFARAYPTPFPPPAYLPPGGFDQECDCTECDQVRAELLARRPAWELEADVDDLARCVANEVCPLFKGSLHAIARFLRFGLDTENLETVRGVMTGIAKFALERGLDPIEACVLPFESLLDREVDRAGGLPKRDVDVPAMDAAAIRERYAP